MTTPRSVSIAYYDPYNVQPNIVSDIRKRLPLHDLRWVSSPPRPIRSITQLYVNLVDETASATRARPQQHQIPGLLDTPYMRILLVRCEDNDTYRGSVRQAIRDWFATAFVATQRDSTEWLIFYYVPEGSSPYTTGTAATNALRLKAGVIDKIRADFNTSSKEDRCVLIKDGIDQTEANKVWDDAIARLRDGIMTAFAKRVQMYEQQAKKLELQKSVPGWNFSTYFVMKASFACEGLALSFENVSLLEDALTQYDGLDETFMQLTKDRTVTFFQDVGFTPESQHALLDRDKDTNVRHQILQTEISLFDFRCYLFSRQASLTLLLISSALTPSIAALRISQLLFRTRKFVSETSKMLVGLGKNRQMVANWVYSVIQEVLDATEVQPAVIQGEGTRDVAEGRAEVLLLARSAMEELAARYGWQIEDAGMDDINLLDSAPDADVDDVDVDKFLHPKLKRALADEVSFMNAYFEITDAARSYYESADRTRSVDKLRAQMAIIKYRQHKYDETVKLLASLPQLYSNQGWDVIATDLFLISADSLYHLDRPEEYLKIFLQLLTNRAHNLGTDLISDICRRVLGACDKLEMTMNFSLAPLFVTTVSKLVRVSAEADDSFFLSAEVFNHFEVEWVLTSITVRLIEPRGMKRSVLFRSQGESVKLAPGRNIMELRTTHNVPGTYQVDNIEFTIGKLVLSEDLTGVKKAADGDEMLVMYQQPGNLDVRLQTPAVMRLDKPKRIVILVYTGWNELENARITARSATTGMRLDMDQATATVVPKASEDNMHVSHSSGSQVEIGTVARDSVVYITVPYIAEPDRPIPKNLQVRAHVEYKTTAGEYYSLSVSRQVSISLSTDVNVKDLFKRDALFSKFSVTSADPGGALRVVAGELRGTDEYEVATGRGTTTPYVAIANQAVTYAYRVTRRAQKEKQVNGHTAPKPLELRIRYRRLEDEVRDTISRTIHDKLKDRSDLEKYSVVVDHHIQGLLRCDLVRYAFLDKIALGEYLQNQWSDVLSAIGKNRDQMDAFLRDFYSADIDRHATETFDSLTKELVIPVEVPKLQVLFTVELQYAPPPVLDFPSLANTGECEQKDVETTRELQPYAFSDKVFYIGQPIPVIVRLTSSRYWAARSSSDADAEQLPSTEFIYEIDAKSDTWLVSGQRKGLFAVSEKTTDLAVLLVPLRRGNLLLPTVEVRPCGPDAIAAEVEYVNNAESVLVLPEASNVLVGAEAS
ncbi:trafficking protein particle complex subunit 10 [Limtongia smithiae]|uniref:trafficking protein particle complex subunit 10 n=1 Tax=Limtongia smithiae TaxID=1125753 RepID=UPI0034CFD8AC